ncbi:MAG: hypothetical protein WAK95_00740 [Desulfobacterales bacterium]
MVEGTAVQIGQNRFGEFDDVIIAQGIFRFTRHRGLVVVLHGGPRQLGDKTVDENY